MAPESATSNQNAPSLVMEPFPTDRLDFTLPDFTRVAWVSDNARRIWEPLIAQIQRAWKEIEWLSVAEGVRECALTRIHPIDLPQFSEAAARRGLNILPLGLESDSGSIYSATPTPFQSDKPLVYPSTIGSLRSVREFKEAWDSNDHDRIGELLGFPACCRDFFRRNWVNQRLVDTTWAMAVATLTSMKRIDQRTVEIESCTFATPIFRWIGVRLVPHLPCAFDCSQSSQLAVDLSTVGRGAGYGREMDRAAEILSWDVEWDAMHGIAEIRLPVVKVITRTDTTAHRYVVRIKGTRTPNEIPSGLRFPYLNSKQPRLTQLSAFRRGLENVSAATATLPDRQIYADNGFSSFRAMQLAHAPIIAVAREALAERSGTVLDLGAGNGLLVSSVCEGTHLTPAGLEIDPDKVARANQLRAGVGSRFIAANMFDLNRWSIEDSIAGVIIMIGRLFEVERAKAEQLLNHLRIRSEVLILYFYSSLEYGDMPTMLERLGLPQPTAIRTDGPTTVALFHRPF